MEYGIVTLQVLTLLIVGWLVKNYFPSYFGEKGKNLATKEDIGAITSEVERARLKYAAELENTKNELQERLENIKQQLTIAAEVSKQYQNLKSQAYVDFIKGVAGIAIAQKEKNKEKEFEATILLTDAKARIAIYGSKEVVRKMAEFFRRYGALNSPAAMRSFVDMIQEMREQTVDTSEAVDPKEVSQLLFSTDSDAG